MKHHEVHPTYVEGCFGCKAASVGLRPKNPPNKQTVDHTDTAVVTTTEHFAVERQDVNVAVRTPITTIGNQKEPVDA